MKFFRSIGEIFGYSPFEALKRHASLCGRAVGTLQIQFNSLRLGKWDEVEKCRDEIDELEHHADKIKDEMRVNLTKSLMIPVDRHDLLELIGIQDEIINHCEHISHMLTFKKVDCPENILDEFEILLSKVMEIVNEYEELIGHTSSLIEKSFSKKEIMAALEHVSHIEEIEHECDLIQIGLHSKILNSNLNPIDAYLTIQWVIQLGEIANYTEKSADKFRIMILSR